MKKVTDCDFADLNSINCAGDATTTCKKIRGADLREGGGFLQGSSTPPARKLVLSGPFHVIDNHDLD
jgi:hypothetical protein